MYGNAGAEVVESLAKASSSFHARGSVTGFQDESSNVGASAPCGSPTSSRQPGLKLERVSAKAPPGKLASAATQSPADKARFNGIFMADSPWMSTRPTPRERT